MIPGNTLGLLVEFPGAKLFNEIEQQVAQKRKTWERWIMHCNYNDDSYKCKEIILLANIYILQEREVFVTI